MTKIVYNACYGGFSLSDEAILRYAEIVGIKLISGKTRFGNTEFTYINEDGEEAYFYDRELSRKDPVLVQVVEELGEKADGPCAFLQIAEVPAGTLFRITEFDGYEAVETQEYIDWEVA